MTRRSADESAAIGRFGTNSLAVLLSYGLDNLLAAVASVFLVRYLGPHDYGLLSTAVAYLSFFLIFANVGVNTVVLREVSREPDRADQLVGAALRLRLFLAGVSFVLCFAALPLLGASGDLVILVLLASGALPFSLFSLYLIRYSAELRMGVPTLAFGAWSVTLTAAKLLMIVLDLPVEAFAATETVSGLVMYLIARRLGVRSGLAPKRRFDRDLSRSIMRQALPVGMTLVLIQVYLRVDQVMLYGIAGAAEVALYTVGVRLVEFANVIPIVFMRSAYPILSRLSAEPGSTLEAATRLSFRAMAWAALPCAAVLFLYPEEILASLFGDEFAGGANGLRILSWSIVFAFANSVLYNQLFATDGHRSAAVLAGSSALLNVALNIPLINALGAEGSAIATLASYAGVTVAALALPRTRSLGATAWLSTVRPVGAIAAAIGVVVLLDPTAWVGSTILLVSYLSLLVALREIGASELRLIRRALGMGRQASEDAEPQPPSPPSL